MRKICDSSKTSCTLVVQLAGALEVGAERLLHDHPGALGEAGLAEGLDDLGGRRRRNAQVVEAAGSRPAARSPPPDRLHQGLGAGLAADVAEAFPRTPRSAADRCPSARTRQHASVAKRRNQSSSRSSREVPIIRNAGIRPAAHRCRRPGNSLRRERSPAAPKSTMTWGESGGSASVGASVGPVGVIVAWPDPSRTPKGAARRGETPAGRSKLGDLWTGVQEVAATCTGYPSDRLSLG